MNDKSNESNSESFKEKLFLIFIEKGIIGAAAGAVILLFQGWLADFQNEKYQNYEISKISSSIVIEQRSKFTRAVQDYLLFIIKNKSEEKLPDNQVNNLKDLTERIKISILTASAIEPKLEKGSEKFISSISQTNQSLYEGGDIPDSEMNNLKNEYRITLESFRTASLDALKNDRKTMN